MTQPLIKLLLLATILLVAIVALRGGQSAAHKAFWRLSGLAVVAAAALSVLFPNALTTIAQALGVDRGTDLLLYVLVVAFMLVVVIMFRRIAELEQKYVRLGRRMALNEAERADRRHDQRNESEE